MLFKKPASNTKGEPFEVLAHFLLVFSLNVLYSHIAPENFHMFYCFRYHVFFFERN